MVLYKTGHGSRVQKYQLGSLGDHTTLEVLAAGLSLALYLLSGKRNAHMAMIWMDNQAVIRSLKYCKPKSTQNLINSVLLQI